MRPDVRSMRAQEPETARRGTRVRRDPVVMSDAVGAFLHASGIGARTRHVPVFRAWNDAVGPALARRARPVRFERGELVVEVDSATHFQELVAFTGEGFRERANEILGEPGIRRVTFRSSR